MFIVDFITISGIFGKSDDELDILPPPPPFPEIGEAEKELKETKSKDEREERERLEKERKAKELDARKGREIRRRELEEKEQKAVHPLLLLAVFAFLIAILGIQLFNLSLLIDAHKRADAFYDELEELRAETENMMDSLLEREGEE